MALFDSLITDVDGRSGINGKGRSLLSALLNFMVGHERGFLGFLDHFRRAGFGDTVDSWISTGETMPLSEADLQRSLGEQNIAKIAADAHIPRAEASSALTYLIPQVISALTPNGEMPSNSAMMKQVESYLPTVAGANTYTTATTTETHTNVPRTETTTPRVEHHEPATTTHVRTDHNEDRDSGGILKWLLPLLLLGLLLFIGFKFCGKNEPANTNVNSGNVNRNANTNANVNNAAAVKKMDSQLRVVANNGKYVVTGTVADEATRKQIVDEMAKLYGAENVDATGLKVDAAARPFASDWWTKFSGWMPNLKDWKTGELAFAGNAVTAASGLPQAAINSLKTAFAGWVLPVSIVGAEGAATAANDAASKKLEDLAKSGGASTDEVVSTLNATIINFASGSSAIPASAQKLISNAAAVLKTMKDSGQIEVSGHTDSTGNAAANMKLSEDRAKSVVAALIKEGVNADMLVAKGYGSEKPVAPNDTADNKFKNRRIEYTVLGSGSGSLSSTTTTTTTTNGNTAASTTTTTTTTNANHNSH